MNVKPSEIQLRSGKFFDYLDMRPESINIHDIAHALSMQCRFNGHVTQFYSVAQHSVIVSRYVQPENALVGLMHDATEAYIGDMASPLKKLIPQFSAFEDDVWIHIAQKFDLPLKLPQNVKDIDKAACLSEAIRLMNVGKDDWGWGIDPLYNATINPWSQGFARKMFLSRYYELTARRES